MMTTSLATMAMMSPLLRVMTMTTTDETLADPYKGKIPFARVNAYKKPFASRQVIYVRINGVFNIPAGLKTRKVFS
jgi:hypothetical protein